MNLDEQIHPDLRQALAESEPFFQFSDIAEKRIWADSVIEDYEIPEFIDVFNVFVPGPAGAPDVRVRVYREKNPKEPQPGLMWLHGGGYVFRKPENEELQCIDIVRETKCIVVSVDYRSAPENPYPAALEDCYAALVWMEKGGMQYNIDPSRLAVAGQSAGGGLTAALSLLARDRKGPNILFQIPIYPMIDDRNATWSTREMLDLRAWNGEASISCWNAYLSGLNRNEDVPAYAAPARATDYSGLPPTYIYVGQLEPFVEEAMQYASDLNRAGIPVELHIYPSCIHGFDVVAPDSPIGRRAVNELMHVIRDGFARSGTW